MTRLTWHRQNRRGGSYAAEPVLVLFDDGANTAARRTRFYVTQRTEEPPTWIWSALAYPAVEGGTSAEIDGVARYHTMKQAYNAAERAAMQGFYWHNGEWLPNGTTRDFPDGIASPAETVRES